MSESRIIDNDKEMPTPSTNNNGNLLPNSIQTHLPPVNDSTLENEESKIQSLAVNPKQVIKVKQTDVYHSSKASHNGNALETIGGNVNTEYELNGTNGTSETCSEENYKAKEAQVERPIEVRKLEKTLRIGWLNKAAGSTKYRKVAKPRGGVKKLKLDATARYSAYQIRRLAMEAFEASSNDNCSAIEEEYVVKLGEFGGQVIEDFKLRDGQVCDIWDYCKDSGKRLYQLNLFMLTSPAEADEEVERRTISTRRTKARPPTIVDDVRVLYQYVRTSRYSSELSYTECDKADLYARLFEDQCGDCPQFEHFEPSDFGYSISRIVKSGQVLLQVSVDDNGAQSTQFATDSPAEQHAILQDVDQLHGYCNRKFGIGFVVSCSHACRPIFSWYRNGQLFKSHEYLYWLDDVKDDQSHLWCCTVTCSSTGRQLHSKQLSVGAFQD